MLLICEVLTIFHLGDGSLGDGLSLAGGLGLHLLTKDKLDLRKRDEDGKTAYEYALAVDLKRHKEAAKVLNRIERLSDSLNFNEGNYYRRV